VNPCWPTAVSPRTGQLQSWNRRRTRKVQPPQPCGTASGGARTAATIAGRRLFIFFRFFRRLMLQHLLHLAAVNRPALASFAKLPVAMIAIEMTSRVRAIRRPARRCVLYDGGGDDGMTTAETTTTTRDRRDYDRRYTVVAEVTTGHRRQIYYYVGEENMNMT